MSRLYFDCGWKSTSEFRCALCSHRVHQRSSQRSTGEDFTYKLALPLMEKHLIDEHLESCYKCLKKRNPCERIFITKTEARNHKHHS